MSVRYPYLKKFVNYSAGKIPAFFLQWEQDKSKTI